MPAECRILGPVSAGPLCHLPFYDGLIPAGFPSPATDHLEKSLDFNDLLIGNRNATFMAQVIGDSMNGAGIFSGDILVVDRALTPRSGQIVLAALCGEPLVKEFNLVRGRPQLCSHHPDYPPLLIDQVEDLSIWGVVTFSIRRHSGGR
ncbi:MAG: translesion error-prone DNA polymerase V autoproteolytic subunit [Pseudomonadota bacterium]